MQTLRSLYTLHVTDQILIVCRYVFCCSFSHNVAPKGKYIAFVSTEVETDNPERELEAGLRLLGPIDEKIIDTYERFKPVNESSLDNCFISEVSPEILKFKFALTLCKVCGSPMVIISMKRRGGRS